MADIAATDVTYALVSRDTEGKKPFRKSVVDITFGDGALTYPAGGVPLTKGKLGLPNYVESLLQIGTANGFVYKYDSANEKLRIWQGDNDNAADAPLIELVGGAATPAAATLRVLAVGW